jgi:hypothetical protein
MKIQEILTEAHHGVLMTLPFGPWQVQIDSHAYATIPHRGIPLESFVGIVSYMCSLPDVLPTIPVGKGAYFQDTNTAISIYVTRVADDTVRVETVLDRTMKPKQPLFRRPVPHWSPNPAKKRVTDKTMQAIQKTTQQRGRDAVAQDAELIQPLTVMNRAQRREFEKKLRRSK